MKVGGNGKCRINNNKMYWSDRECEQYRELMFGINQKTS